MDWQFYYAYTGRVRSPARPGQTSQLLALPKKKKKIICIAYELYTVHPLGSISPFPHPTQDPISAIKPWLVLWMEGVLLYIWIGSDREFGNSPYGMIQAIYDTSC